MRLINLQVQGLNSFSRKAEIDFQSLFKKGVFGIFGATGSGKSSILDAVFLALYGKVLRSKTEKEFINTNVKTAKVKLVFEMREEGVDKIFEVNRDYTLNKNNKIVKRGKLFLINGNERTQIANTDLQTTNKIINIIGFGDEEFQKFIALPQGQFAQFLKDTPKEKINTIAKLFNLECFGDEFALKLKFEKAENEKRKEYLRGVLEQYVNVDEKSIEEEAKEIDRLKVKANEISEKYSHKKEQLLDLEKTLSWVNERNEIKFNLEKLSLKQRKFDEDFYKLNILKTTFALAPSYSKIKILREEKEKLENRREEITTQITATSNAYFQSVSANDENKTNLMVKLAQCERRHSLLLAVNQDAERYYEIEKEKNNLVKVIAKQRKELNKLKTVFDDNTLSLESSLKILKKLDDAIETKPIARNIVDTVSKFEQTNAQKETYKTVLESLEKEQKILLETKQKLINDLYFNDEKLNKFRKQLTSATQAIKEFFGSADSPEIALEGAVKEFITLKIKGKIYLDVKAELKTLKENANELLLANKENKVVLDNIKADLESVENKINSSNEENDKLINLKQQLLSTQADTLQNILVNGDEREAILTQISKLSKQLKELEVENQEFISNNQNDLEAKIMKKENVVLKLQNLISALNRTKDATYSKERACVRISANIEDLAKQEAILNEKIENYQTLVNTLSEQENRFNSFEKKIFLKDAQTFAKFQEQQNLIIKQQKGVISQILKYVELKETSSIEYFNFKTICNQNEMEFDHLSAEMKLIVKKLRDLNINGYVKDEIANNLSNINTVRQELSNINNHQNDLLKEETKLKLEKASLITEIVIKSKELESSEIEFRAQCDLAGLSEDELKNEVVYDDILKLEKDVNKYLADLDDAKDDLRRVEKVLNGKTTSEDEVQKIENLVKKLETELVELSSSIAFKENKNKNDFENIKKLEYFKTEYSKVVNKEKFYLELSKINGNNEMLKFITEEYILNITEKANNYFATLTNGRFQLLFNEDFIVVDNINGGATRSIGTLSGGETFLASLSVAISIVETLSKIKDKPLDFVFLDEGFGTLDEDSIEMVMIAIRNLINTNLVFGLITHEELVKYKTPSRIEVFKTSKEGSKVEVVL